MSAPHDDAPSRRPTPETRTELAPTLDEEAVVEDPSPPPGRRAGHSAWSAATPATADDGVTDAADSAERADGADEAGAVDEAGNEAGTGAPGSVAPVPAVLPPSIPPRRRPAPSIAPAAPRRRRPHIPSALTVFVLILLIAALFKTFVLQTYEIPSGSMEDTLRAGDQVAVTMYDATDIQRGDVVVFTDPDNWLDVTEPTGVRGLIQDALELVRLLPQDTGHHLIKRVIGVGGDHIVADGQGALSVNGVQVEESYLKPGTLASEVPFDVVVPEGHVWVMGDNRANSADSRFHRADAHGGFVPRENIVGVAKSVIWPAGRWEALTQGRQVFAQVSQGRDPAQGPQ